MSVAPSDHVHVGDDEAGRIDDHAGAERALHLAAAVAGDAEEVAEDRIVEQRIAVLHHLGGIDVDHRRGHPLHHRRVGEAATAAGVGTTRTLRLSRRRPGARQDQEAGEREGGEGGGQA